MANFLIYGLLDPQTGEIRYVGKSCSGLRRAKQTHAAYCGSWQKSLLRLGLRSEVCVLEEFFSSEPLCEAEIFWISYWRKQGARLTNLTDDGEGVTGWKCSEEWKENLRKKTIFRFPINFGRKHPEEEKKRRGARAIGRKQFQKTIEKRASKLRGQKRTSETRQKMRIAKLGRVLPEITKMRLSKAGKKAWEVKRKKKED